MCYALWQIREGLFWNYQETEPTWTWGFFQCCFLEDAVSLLGFSGSYCSGIGTMALQKVPVPMQDPQAPPSPSPGSKHFCPNSTRARPSPCPHKALSSSSCSVKIPKVIIKLTPDSLQWFRAKNYLRKQKLRLLDIWPKQVQVASWFYWPLTGTPVCILDMGRELKVEC